MFLESKYPIYVPAMNGCSDSTLAIACWKAGCTPALLAWNTKEFVGELDKTAASITDQNFSVVLADNIFTDPKSNKDLIVAILKAKPKYIEFWASKPKASEFYGNVGYQDFENIEVVKLIEALKRNSKIIFRAYEPVISDQYDYLIDAFSLKSSGSAGGFSEYTNQEFISEFQKITDKPLIPTGGVGCSEQIKELLDLGAAAVGIGTLFAASVESSISEEAKLKLIAKNSNDLSTFNNTNQHAIVLSNDAHAPSEDWNRIDSLTAGIKTGASGHIYAGASIDFITEILPVSAIVSNLIQKL